MAGFKETHKGYEVDSCPTLMVSPKIPLTFLHVSEWLPFMPMKNRGEKDSKVLASVFSTAVVPKLFSIGTHWKKVTLYQLLKALWLQLMTGQQRSHQAAH